MITGMTPVLYYLEEKLVWNPLCAVVAKVTGKNKFCLGFDVIVSEDFKLRFNSAEVPELGRRYKFHKERVFKLKRRDRFGLDIDVDIAEWVAGDSKEYTCESM